MDVQQHVEYWLTGSQDDIEAAAVLLEKRKIGQSLFFAHLAIEKVLKAHVSKVTETIPPRTHDLLRLARLAGLSVPESRSVFLARLQRYCLEGRYPDVRWPRRLGTKHDRNWMGHRRSGCGWPSN